MLRRELGDIVFHNIIRNYYSAYAGKNADTRDFERICETTSGKDLKSFFNQWLYTPGLPELNVQWRYDDNTKSIAVTVSQIQNDLFQFPLEIQIENGSKPQWETLAVTQKNQSFIIKTKDKPTQIKLDPHASLLFDGSVSQVN
jgi:aminopeptidase N